MLKLRKIPQNWVPIENGLSLEGFSLMPLVKHISSFYMERRK